MNSPVSQRLQGKRILLTQASEFMGPVLQRVLREHGADVIADERPLLDPALPQQLVAAAGQVDVLIANLAIPAPRTPATETTDAEWDDAFAHLVSPLPRLARAVLPQMLARQAGKILVMGSASALRGQKNLATYGAARGAQLGWVKNLGVEVAGSNVQVNAIAQNFVDNPTYFPPSVQANPAFQERLRREVPAGRLGTPEEDAMLVVFLCSDECNFLVGQAIPFSGGWAV